MTNYEYHKNEIEKLTRMGLRIAIKEDTKEICTCSNIHCKRCLFHSNLEDNCTNNAMRWADEEYIESEYIESVDWSKVEVDTPVLVSKDRVSWARRYFAQYEDGLVYTWSVGRTSWTSEGKEHWEYTKLAEKDVEENETTKV